MRRITLWLFSTVAALVLLFSYRTSTNSGGTAATISSATAPATTGTTGTPSGSGTSSGAKTYSGRWGPVQVTITVSGGKITSVAVPTYPNGNNRDEEINGYALPVLTQETLSAQSANIDTVSGAP